MTKDDLIVKMLHSRTVQVEEKFCDGQQHHDASQQFTSCAQHFTHAARVSHVLQVFSIGVQKVWGWHALNGGTNEEEQLLTMTT